MFHVRCADRGSKEARERVEARETIANQETHFKRTDRMHFPILIIAKLFDPFLIVIALVAGGFSRAWWHVVAGAFAAAAVIEFLLHQIQVTRTFSPESLIAGFVAACAWAALAFWIMERRRRKAAADATPDSIP
jgi:hypothetical protein